MTKEMATGKPLQLTWKGDDGVERVFDSVEEFVNFQEERLANDSSVPESLRQNLRRNHDALRVHGMVFPDATRKILDEMVASGAMSFEEAERRKRAFAVPRTSGPPRWLLIVAAACLGLAAWAFSVAR